MLLLESGTLRCMQTPQLASAVVSGDQLLRGAAHVSCRIRHYLHIISDGNDTSVEGSVQVMRNR